MLNDVLQRVCWCSEKRNVKSLLMQELNFHRHLFKYVGEPYAHLEQQATM